MFYQPAIARLEKLDRLVEARVTEIVKDFDERRSLAEFFQLFHDDLELVQWHTEREELRKNLFIDDAAEDCA